MPTASDKRRYSVSLRPVVVDRFQSLARSLGMPPSIMSAACEDALKGVADIFQLAKDRGSLEIKDIRHLLDTQMGIFEQEEVKTKRGYTKKQERNPSTG